MHEQVFHYYNSVWGQLFIKLRQTKPPQEMPKDCTIISSLKALSIKKTQSQGLGPHPNKTSNPKQPFDRLGKNKVIQPEPETTIKNLKKHLPKVQQNTHAKANQAISQRHT